MPAAYASLRCNATSTCVPPGCVSDSVPDPGSCTGAGCGPEVLTAGAIQDGGGSSSPTCSDMVKNQGESDVDCGGSTTCARCETNRTCTLPKDCLSGIC